MELNNTYLEGDDDNVTKRFQVMCLLMLADYEQYSGIWGDLKNITLLVTDNYPKTLTAAYEVSCHLKIQRHNNK